MDQDNGREQTLASALMLYRIAVNPQEQRWSSGIFLQGTDLQREEKRLKKNLERAQRELAEFNTGKAVCAALDAMLPGWMDHDVSSLLSAKHSGMFVSNSAWEWLVWLVDKGAPVCKAWEFLADKDNIRFRSAWPKEMEGVRTVRAAWLVSQGMPKAQAEAAVYWPGSPPEEGPET